MTTVGMIADILNHFLVVRIAVGVIRRLLRMIAVLSHADKVALIVVIVVNTQEFNKRFGTSPEIAADPPVICTVFQSTCEEKNGRDARFNTSPQNARIVWKHKES